MSYLYMTKRNTFFLDFLPVLPKDTAVGVPVPQRTKPKGFVGKVVGKKMHQREHSEVRYRFQLLQHRTHVAQPPLNFLGARVLLPPVQ